MRPGRIIALAAITVVGGTVIANKFGWNIPGFRNR